MDVTVLNSLFQPVYIVDTYESMKEAVDIALTDCQGR